MKIVKILKLSENWNQPLNKRKLNMRRAAKLKRMIVFNTQTILNTFLEETKKMVVEQKF